MTKLIKIGNSQGIRIPKLLIEEAKLQNVEIDLKVTTKGLLLKPIKSKKRKNWEKNIKKILSENQNFLEEIKW